MEFGNLDVLNLGSSWILMHGRLFSPNRISIIWQMYTWMLSSSLNVWRIIRLSNRRVGIMSSTILQKIYLIKVIRSVADCSGVFYTFGMSFKLPVYCIHLTPNHIMHFLPFLNDFVLIFRCCFQRDERCLFSA